MGIVIALLIFWGKAKTFLWIILILLAIALGIEGFNYDVDLQKLWETRDYNASRIESVVDKDGNTIRLIGSCVKADINCDNFRTQNEAQEIYERCAREIEANNNIANVKSLDIYGLDRDKDEIVCEALPPAQL